METARGLAELLKTGWKPRRTIVIASWDGEEWGLLGSTEWAEKHRDELASNAVAYINSDSTGKGWLSMSGSHSLEAFINDVARDVPDPRGTGKSVAEAKRARLLEQATTDAARAAISGRRHLAIDALGSGSDYTAFLDFLQIASLDVGFSGDSSGGVYHSVYDTYHWYTHFSDGDFRHTAALSRVIGTALLRLADADVLPFEFKATAATLRGYVDEIARMPEVAGRVDLSPVRQSLARLASAAEAYEKALGRLDRLDAGETTRARGQLGELNTILYRTERAFRHEAGLPRREWFKHLVYAPGLYTGYGVKTLPGIREGIEQSHWDEAESFVAPVAAAIGKLTSDVSRATSALRRITDH
jgi:N-acetylated-alpha-linked acidic dipeptidase